ncbi:MAG: hypothetical protein GY730_03295 [bacterium]|nr:hypothetical protein [bacterium]
MANNIRSFDAQSRANLDRLKAPAHSVLKETDKISGMEKDIPFHKVLESMEATLETSAASDFQQIQELNKKIEIAIEKNKAEERQKKNNPLYIGQDKNSLLTGDGG